ncbi:outer membrane lipoprotein chaperone LolA [Aliidiomarina taiwanensis]|nr:outer membrane lipoprotein chaperone LolA [Aliidiomarina taiwanensis]
MLLSKAVRRVVGRIFLCVSVAGGMLVTSSLQAQEQSVQAQSLQTLLNQIHTLTGRFEQHIYEYGEPVEVLQGHFALQRPSQLYWETEAPDESVLVADGETVWYYSPFIEQVSLYSQSATMASNPLLVLLENNTWEGFSIEQVAGQWVINGEGEAQGQQLILAFDDNQQLAQIELSDAYGQKSIFHLQQTQLNQPVASETFQFEVPRGVEIDDQRGM